MKAYTSGIKIAIEKAMAVYNSELDMTIKNDETGFTVEFTIPHVTDHIFQELKNHIRFLTGQRIVSWDVLPEDDNQIRLVIRITNGWEPDYYFSNKKGDPQKNL